MPYKTRQDDRRKLSSRRERRTSTKALTGHGVESLEGRCLLSVAINEFGSSVAPTAPAGITTGPDGNLWFTEADINGGSIDRLTPSGTIQRYTQGLSQFAIPTGITTGPDNALWFTESGTDQIGRIDPFTGIITEFGQRPGMPTITRGSQPVQITLGPDNNLWFTEQSGNQIGRITTSGVVSEFATSVSGQIESSKPVGIVAGPDNALWFTESNTDRIGRITTNGVVTNEFGQTPGQTVIPADFAPTGIALGSDGNLWFTEMGSQNSFGVGGIGKVIASGPGLGTITQFTQGVTPGLTVATGPGGITPGPDGALYFTETISGRIGRITTGGIANEFTQGYAPTDVPANITQGPDGNLWFTELGNPSFNPFVTGNPGTHVDRITTDGVVTQFPRPDAFTSTAFLQDITAGLNGTLFFTDRGNNSLGTIDTSGNITSLPNSSITPNAGLRSIAARPDGTIFFVESLLGRIGKLATDGTITEISLGAGHSPGDLVSAADGTIYFTDSVVPQPSGPAVAMIGRISPQGNLTEVSQGLTSNDSLLAITIGPDGAVYFTENLVNSSSQGRIGRVDPATNNITFLTPTLPNGSPTSLPNGLSSITAGSDGALYFTENELDAVGRITLSGVFTEFSILNPGETQPLSPNGITKGPDGAIYVTLTSSDEIAKLNPDGSFTRIAVPTLNGSPTQMAVGGDNNLYFVEFVPVGPGGFNQIGQVILPQSSLFVIPGTVPSLAIDQTFTAILAGFSDASTAANLTNFDASIDFGDGSPIVAGVVRKNGTNSFFVTGTHAYANAGTFRGGVTILNQAGRSIAQPFTAVVTASVPQLTFVVTNTNDSGRGSLRQAIQNANAVGGHAITFAIPGTSGAVQTIKIASPLPVIVGPTTIDGISEAVFQQSNATSPLIEIDGSASSPASGGLVFGAKSSRSALLSISIFGFAGHQVELDSDGDIIQGNSIGLPVSSIPGSTTASISLGSDGLFVRGSGEIIGGMGAGERNVISGNRGHGIEFAGAGATGSFVFGNYIGTNASGNRAVANLVNGIVIANGASSITIGPGNVISGNGDIGIEVFASAGNHIFGSFIGTDRTGNVAIGNVGAGICLDGGSTGNTIGGSATEAPNVISGNSIGVAVRDGSHGNTIRANMIGTNLAGNAALGNGIVGVFIADSPMNTVGPMNLISGNGATTQGAGVWIDGPGSSGNKVVGNLIGTDLAGKKAIPNKVIGVLIDNASGNMVGGLTMEDRNVISGNTFIGVMIATDPHNGPGASGNLVIGNYIGTNVGGTGAVGNGGGGDGAGVYIDFAAGNFIGGTAPGFGNLISGNVNDGIQVFGSGSAGNFIQGNRIGTDFTGTLALGNSGNGILVNDAPGTTIALNFIGANTLNGIMTSGAGSTGTSILNNVIGQGIAGQALGNQSFGVLAANGAPSPTGSGNILANNTNGPTRNLGSTTASPAPISILAAHPHSKTAHKKVTPKSKTIGAKHLKHLQNRGHAKAKSHH